jgi:photosystem II stability/assembly factor-like uncharacterized protein
MRISKSLWGIPLGISLLCPMSGMCASGELNFHRVSFADDSNGIALGTTDESSFVLVSNDGGKGWHTVYESPIVLKAAILENAFSGWVVGDGGLILRTADGGHSWSKVKSGIGQNINQVTIGQGGKLFVVANGGILLTSVDRGQTWKEQLLNGGRDLLHIAVLKSGRIIILARDRLLISDDGGMGWQAQSTVRWTTLDRLGFFDDEVGLLSGGVLAATSDAGKTVNWVNIHTDERVGPVTVTGENTAFLLLSEAKTGSLIHVSGEKLSSSSTILQTDDRGVHWKRVFHLSDGNTLGASLEDMFWNNQKHGWAVGEAGLITMTDDGGHTWNVCRLTTEQGQQDASTKIQRRQWEAICGGLSSADVSSASLPVKSAVEYGVQNSLAEDTHVHESGHVDPPKQQ